MYLFPEKPRLIHFSLINNFSSGYIAEKKYNGSRLELHINGGKFEFWDRHKNRLSYKPSPEVMDALTKIKFKGYCILDGELRHNKVRGIYHKIIFYDFIVRNGNILTIEFSDRRKILNDMFSVESEPIGITKQYSNDFSNLFTNVISENEIENQEYNYRDYG